LVLQVETYLGKLSSDKAYKQEYTKLWNEQRRYWPCIGASCAAKQDVCMHQISGISNHRQDCHLCTMQLLAMAQPPSHSQSLCWLVSVR